jgi:uncharacterized membrane protein
MVSNDPGVLLALHDRKSTIFLLFVIFLLLTSLLAQVNFLIIFCVGMTAFGSFLDAFKQPTSVLAVVAAKFPSAATFFVSYIVSRTSCLYVCTKS